MKIAMLSPIAWRTPPRHYGPWENVVSLITEGLVKRGIDVTLFATGESVTGAKLHSICQSGYEEDKDVMPKVWESLHISEVFEKAHEFDLIHNNFDFLPLTYSKLVKTPLLTTIHGFSSRKIYPVYEKYNDSVYYVSISNADRYDKIDYTGTVYHGINMNQFTFNDSPEDYLVFFGRIHHDKGAREAINIALSSGKKLVMAGIIQDENYYESYVKPRVDGDQITYVGSVGPEARDKLLRNASALLHPINFAEPFGLSVIESMACGTPVIAFKKGSMAELIDDGENGFLVHNVEDAVSVVNRISEIDRKKCLEKVEKNFTVDAMVDNYIKIYDKILSGKA